MPLLTRRRLLAVLGIGGLSAVGARFGLPRLWRVGPARPVEGEARAFVERCFEGLDRAKLWDGHVHVIGMGTNGSGCDFDPDWQSHLHPWKRFQYELYLGAAGIPEGPDWDEQYVERLLRLHRLANPEGKLVLLAFDRRYDESGAPDDARTPFYVPNSWVLEVAARHEELVPCASIHPYRVDALDALDEAFDAGARAVKWLPSAMGILPSSPRCEPFYERLARLGLPLITHAGEEQSVEVHGDQDFGNPLHLRVPLDMGVKVVVAHCASLGESTDLDQQGTVRTKVPCYDLFVRLFREARYRETLFADVSAMTFVNRCGRPLRETLMFDEQEQERLVYASDYPLPALDPLMSTRFLERHGYLTAEERRLCNLVFDANPLLFDFVVKRTIAVREDGREHRFADSVFHTSWLFG